MMASRSAPVGLKKWRPADVGLLHNMHSGMRVLQFAHKYTNTSSQMNQHSPQMLTFK